MEENQVKIPEGWRLLSGENLFKVQGGYAFKSSDYKEEGILLVRIGNVGNGSFHFKDLVYVSSKFKKTHSSFLLNKNDVLIGLTGDLGKVCMLKHGDLPYILNQRVGRFLVNENIEKNYLFYLVSSDIAQSKLEAYFAGGAQKNISPKQIESLSFLLPKSTTEQRQIATILSKVDEAINQTEQLIAKYQRIKTGLMQDLLTKGIDENGNIRSEETHAFKDSPLGRIPVEWEVDSLGNIIGRGNGIIQTGPFGSQLHANEYVLEGIPVIMPQDIKTENIDDSQIARISDEKTLKLKRHIVKENDILFARRGDLNKCNSITKEFEGAICGTGCLLIRPNNSKLNSNWLVVIYKHHSIQKEIDITAVGSTMKNLNTTILSNLFIPRIPIDEQDLIMDKLTNCVNTVVANQNQLKKLNSIKNGLMQDLLSGKVRVKMSAPLIKND